MKRLVWLGALLAGAVIWSVSLFISRYFAAPQAEMNMVLSVLAVGTPAAILALAVNHLRLRRPLVLCVTAYCLASAAATGVLHRLQAPEGVPAIRSLEAALIHAGSLTLFIPSDRGYIFAWANLLWLAAAGLIASIVLEAVAPKPGTKAVHKPAAHSHEVSGSAPKGPRSLRPRRKPTRRDGTDREA